MRLSWQPCRYLQGPSTAPCPSPTWQQEHTRLPVARARRAGTAHHLRPRYDLSSFSTPIRVTRHASMLCCPLYICIMCTREMCLCPGKKNDLLFLLYYVTNSNTLACGLSAYWCHLILSGSDPGSSQENTYI